MSARLVLAVVGHLIVAATVFSIVFGSFEPLIYIIFITPYMSLPVIVLAPRDSTEEALEHLLIIFTIAMLVWGLILFTNNGNVCFVCCRGAEGVLEDLTKKIGGL